MARGDSRPIKVGERVMDERRKHRRSQKLIKLEFHKTKLFFLKGPADVAEALDVSTTGVRLNTKMELAIGDKVALEISRDGDEPSVTLSGKVVWLNSMKEDGQAFNQAGVEFTRLGLKQRVLLVRLTTGL